MQLLQFLQFLQLLELNSNNCNSCNIRRSRILQLLQLLEFNSNNGSNCNNWRHRAGRLTADDKKTKEEMQKKGQKILDAEKKGDQILDLLASAGSSAKRRRVNEKQPDAMEVKKEDGDAERKHFHTHLCRYEYTGPDTIRTRKQARGLGAQNLTRAAQRFLVGDTHDLDIHNSVFNVLLQLVQRLQPEPALPEPLRTALEQCATNRADVCQNQLHMPADEGKHLLTSVLYGGSVPARLQGNDFMAKVQKVSVYLRWLAVSLLTAEFDEFCGDNSGKKNPESSALAHLYMACEDAILQERCSFLMEKHQPQHMSLHFDGVRISRAPNVSAQELCAESMGHIFQLQIVDKRHFTVLELLQKEALQKQDAKFAPDDVLRQHGNCIPHAMACLEKCSPDAVQRLGDARLPNNVYREERGCRTYRQCSELLDCTLCPAFWSDTIPGDKWLMHLENGSVPHCVAVAKVPDAVDTYILWDTAHILRIKADALLSAVRGGTDSKSCTCFLLQQPEGGQSHLWSEQDTGALLDLAAAGDSDIDACGHDRHAAAPCYWVGDSEDEPRPLEAEQPHPQELQWLDSDGLVTVEADLVSSLDSEAQRIIQALAKKGFPSSNGVFHCPGCPFRSFDRPTRLRQHLVRHHIKTNNFCCSGKKQLKVILSLHDSDMLRGQRKGNLLRRSAELIRKSIRPPLSATNIKIDTWIRLLLDARGPKLVHVAALSKRSLLARRVGNIWYSKDFAEKLFQEMLLHHAKAGHTKRFCSAAFLTLLVNYYMA